MRARKAYSEELVDVYDYRHFGGRSGRHILRKDTQALEALLPPAPAVILDVPCGTGAYAAVLTDRRYEVVTVDLSLPMLEMVGRRGLGVPRTLADVNNLPLTENSIDAAVVLRLFSHFSKDDVLPMLRELRRVVKPDGRLIFDTFRWSPRHWPALNLILDESCICPIHDRDVETLIEQAGLTRVDARSAYLFSPIWQRKLPVWLLEPLTSLELMLPQRWLLRRFWACREGSASRG